MKDTLGKWELQELTLMVGGRQGLRTYLGMEETEFRAWWKEKQLLDPTAYVGSLKTVVLTAKVVELGSITKAAIFYGVSVSFLKKHLVVPSQGFEATMELNEATIGRYRSVRFVARMTKKPESEVRGFVKKHGLENLLTYDFSSHNNAKGRRAEMWWAGLRGENILQDCNLAQGCQADIDFVDQILGKVNVKASKAHRYTAHTRRANPRFWKFSANGIEKADTVVVVLYDEKMRIPETWTTFNPAEILGKNQNSFIVQVVKGKPVLA